MDNDKILEIARRHLKLTWVNDDPEELIAFAQSLLKEELVEKAELTAAKKGAAFFREQKDNSILEAIYAQVIDKERKEKAEREKYQELIAAAEAIVMTQDIYGGIPTKIVDHLREVLVRINE